MSLSKGTTSAYLASAALVIIFLVDLVAPPALTIWYLYLVPVALTYQSGKKWMPYAVAAASMVLLLTGFALQSPGLPLQNFFATSAIDLSLIWATAAVVVQLRSSEEKLRHSVATLSATIESTVDGLLVVDSEGKVAGYNRRFLEMWDIPAQDEGMKDARVCLAFVRAQLKSAGLLEEAEKRMFDDPQGSCRIIIERRDGRHIEIHSMPPTSEEETVGRVWSFRDITENRRAEEELKHTNERLDLVARSNNDALWDWNMATGDFWWNETFHSFYGYASDVTPSLEALLAHVHPEDVQRVRNRFALGFQHAIDEWRDDFRFLRADGSYSSVVSRVIAQRGPGGEPARILGSLVDITAQKNVESALATERNMLRTVIDNLPDRIYVKDAGCRFLLNNRAHMLALGARSQEDTVGKTDFDFRPKDLAEQYHADDRHVIDTGVAMINKEEKTTLGSGKQGWLLTSKLPMRDGDEAIVGLVGISRDITARRSAEESLRESELRYRSLFDTVPVGIYRSTLEGKYLTVNPELVRILGYASPEELLAATTDLKHEFYVRSGRRAEFIHRIREEGMVFGFESQAYRKDRSIIWVSENARPLYDPQGALTGFEGITTDITARKNADESTQRLLQAVEQTDDIVLMTDAAGRMVYTNPAFERVYGYTREETMGLTPQILKSGRHGTQTYAGLWSAILSGQKTRVEMINKTKNGQLVTVDSTVGPVFDSCLGLTGFIAVQRDITERKRMEEEKKLLEAGFFQAQKLEGIGTLAGGIAHDFNNMLGIILGHAFILRKDLTTAAGKKGVDTIMATVKRGSELVKQILVFARKGEVVTVPVNMNEMVPEIHTMIAETFPRTIEIILDLAPRLPLIKADKTQIHQTLLNLCVNARDAMPDGGTLRIATTQVMIDEVRRRVPEAQGTEFVRTTVRDTGTGMDESTRARLFEPFFTTKGPGKGTGLGLSVVYGIMKAHAGYIDVQSGPGKGTSFDLYIPVYREVVPVAGSVSESLAETQGGTETILVAEDEAALREMLLMNLKGKGYTVLVATDGREAVDLYKEHRGEIALVITDIGLPKMDGAKVFDELRKITPTVAVLVSSGYIDPDVRARFLKAGAAGFLLKPYAPTEVVKKVREILDRR
jgi:two-component system, cell cycle sensor histidine kinase and response regulator CckA